MLGGGNGQECRQRQDGSTLGGGTVCQHPLKSFIKISKYFNSRFACGFAQHFEHAGKAKGSVTTDEDSAPRLGRKQIALRQTANILGRHFDLSDVTDINELGIGRVKLGIAGELLLVIKNVGRCNCA